MPKITNEADFNRVIGRAISEGRHVEYLNDVLKKYDYYKTTFSNIFSTNPPKGQVCVFEVTYEDGNTLRVVEILGSQTFEDLAKHIILSMGWVNDHMHGYELTGKKELPDPLYTGSSLTMYAEGWEDDPHPTYKTSDIFICDIDYKKQPNFDFTFDYGDGHQFRVAFQARRRKSSSEMVKNFPRLIESRGAGPEQYPEI